MIFIEPGQTYLIITVEGLKEAHVHRIEVAEDGDTYIRYAIDDIVYWSELWVFKNDIKLEIKYD